MCAHDPCTGPQEGQVHIKASAIIPQEQEIDMQELAGRGPWGRCAAITGFCGLLWCRCCRRSGRRCCRLVCGCLRCRCLCWCRRRAPRPGTAAPAARPARHEDSETESEGEQGAEHLCQADQVALDHHGKITSLTTEPCRDVARGDPVPLLIADARVSCLDSLPVDLEGRAAFRACEYHRATYGSSQEGRVCSVQGCLEAATACRDGVPLCRLHGAREERPAAAGRASGPSERPRGKAKGPGRPADPGVGPTPSGECSLAGPASPQDVADVVTELLPGRNLAEAYQALHARAAGRSDPRRWLDVSFQRAVEEAGVAYLSRAQQDGLEDTPAYAALQALVRGSTGQHGAGDDPVLSLFQTESPVPDGVPAREARWPEATEVRGAPAPRAELRPSVEPSGLFRPRGTREAVGPRLVPSPGSLSAFPGAATRPALGLEALRPHHAGAYSDPSLHHLDETSKALQTIAKAMLAKDEPSAQDRGKLSSTGKTEERMMFLARGCDTLTIHLGAATVGKDLFHALRHVAAQDRPLLREVGFPVNVNNRIAFGFASLSLGGKGTLPEYSLGVADFPQTSEEEFDLFSPPGDYKLEKRPRNPTSLTGWYRSALRQAWSTACVLGVEYYGAWEQAAAHLLRLGEEHSHAWPLSSVIATWEELWSRFVEELRSLDRRARREMQEESPSFDRLRFFATAPGGDGEPWLRLPQTFNLQDPEEYFQVDLLPRQQRMLDRACWSLALRKGGALQGARAGEGSEAPSPQGPPPARGATAAGEQRGPPAHGHAPDQ